MRRKATEFIKFKKGEWIKQEITIKGQGETECSNQGADLLNAWACLKGSLWEINERKDKEMKV